MAEAMVNRKRFRFNFRGSLCMPYGVFMVLFVILPLLVIVYYAFSDKNGVFPYFGNWVEFSNFKSNSGSVWDVIGFTLIISSLTTILCILIAYPIAFLLSNSKFNKNRVLVYIFLIPMWINFVVRTVGLRAIVNFISLRLFGQELTVIDNGTFAILIGMVYDYLPFAILPLYNQMLKMDKNQIEAAADLGANTFRVFYKVIIPMTVPGIVSACMMTFMPTMSSYVIANKMSEGNRQIIGSLIAQYFIEDTSPGSNNVGSAVALFLLVAIGISILIEKLFSGKEDSRKVGIW